ncbi:hypothetical protein H8E88_02315 [candidate division KSB1 bacterium]|nr:hypothetical protein [candidate division KSB1 bacterium]
MVTLDVDLQKVKNTMDEFGDLCKRILTYLPNVLGSYKEKACYKIYSSQIADNLKYVRPINNNLFIYNSNGFSTCFELFKSILHKIRNKEESISIDDTRLIDIVTYTIQQSIGVGLDLLVSPNSARKHVGNRFEELIKVILTNIGVANKKIVLQIPYKTDSGTKVYKCENDLVLSPYKVVNSTTTNLDENEVVVSIKTTSKDRMGKIFIDKMLLEKFVGHPQKVIGIFLNDVQRKNTDNISYTLVSGLFMVYTNFLTKVEGIYYIDPPPTALRDPFSNYMKPFSELITKDITNLLTSK